MSAPKRNRVVISSNHVDRHGDLMTKEALQQMVDTINNNESRVRMGVDHRRDFPPRGRLENAELVERDNHIYVEADYCEFEKSEVVPWNNNYIKEYFDSEFQFAEVDNSESLEVSVSVDPHNFKGTFNEVKDFTKSIKTGSNVDFTLVLHGRKSLIPDPEVVFKLASSFLLYHFLKPTVKKIGEKIADEISDKAVEEGEKIVSFISKTLKEIFYRCIPKARPVAVIFDFPGKPHIELIARTRDEKLVLKALSKKRLTDVKKEIEELSQNVDIAKIQFLLSTKGRWKFNYLLTANGEAIGDKLAFGRRDRKYELMGKQKFSRGTRSKKR